MFPFVMPPKAGLHVDAMRQRAEICTKMDLRWGDGSEEPS
jgi:hypothetical protein